MGTEGRYRGVSRRLVVYKAFFRRCADGGGLGRTGAGHTPELIGISLKDLDDVHFSQACASTAKCKPFLHKALQSRHCIRVVPSNSNGRRFTGRLIG